MRAPALSALVISAGAIDRGVKVRMGEHGEGERAQRCSDTKARRRGRPASAPASPLAAFIVARAQALALPRGELGDRLGISPSTLSRLLSGKIRWTRVAPLTIADALNLSEADQARLLALCGQAAQYKPASRPATPTTAATRAPGRLRGRRARAAVSPVGSLLEPLLAARGMTRAALAHELGVKASTVTRLMNGAHTSSHAISAQGVSDALGLQGIARRDFLQRALALGAFALVGGQSAPSVVRYRSLDLDQFDEDMLAAQRLLDAGHAQQGLLRAQSLYGVILTTAFPRTHKQMAPRRIEAALLLGRAQEAALQWGSERAGRTIRTYNHIDRQILSVFAPAEFAHYYARLYERRAPLYREMDDYAESIRQFTLAIEVFMPYVDDVALLALLFRNRAHVWATQGREREWRRDLDSAARVVSRVTGAASAQLEGLIVYGEAEGYKRLAGATSSENAARQCMYARKAIDGFHAARALTQEVAESHHVLLDVSLAQAYLWLDADESERQARALYHDALSTYPSLMSKCEQTIAQAMAIRSPE